jgi:hypothetical protein
MRIPRRSTRPAAPLVVAALLAACGDTGPTAPAARAALAIVGTSPGPGPIAPVPSVAVTLRVDDQSGYTDYGAPGTTVRFESGGVAKLVVDNSASDSDARVGHYRVWMPAASAYTATVTVMPAELSAAGASKTVSAFVTPTYVAMGSIVLQRKPRLTVELYRLGALVGGQAIRVTAPWGWSAMVMDGSVADEDFSGDPSPADGRIHLRLPVTGIYIVCPLSTPHPLLAAQCRTVHATTYGGSYSATLTYY